METFGDRGDGLMRFEECRVRVLVSDDKEGTRERGSAWRRKSRGKGKEYRD